MALYCVAEILHYLELDDSLSLELFTCREPHYYLCFFNTGHASIVFMIKLLLISQHKFCLDIDCSAEYRVIYAPSKVSLYCAADFLHDFEGK